MYTILDELESTPSGVCFPMISPTRDSILSATCAEIRDERMGIFHEYVLTGKLNIRFVATASNFADAKKVAEARLRTILYAQFLEKIHCAKMCIHGGDYNEALKYLDEVKSYIFHWRQE